MVYHDLHATDAGYLADCVSRFIRSREVRGSQNVREALKLCSTHSNGNQHYSGFFTHLENSRALSDCLPLFLCNIYNLNIFCIKYMNYNAIIISRGMTLQ